MGMGYWATPEQVRPISPDHSGEGGQWPGDLQPHQAHPWEGELQDYSEEGSPQEGVEVPSRYV